MKRGTVTYDITPAGCWECTSHRPDRAGYPSCNRKTGTRISHRMYEARYGPLSPGTVLRHSCDNPACINPDHLLPGTHADNVADRVARGRSACGERNGRAKLTAAQVREIRSQPNERPSILAARYGVDDKVIRQIRTGKLWQSVPSVGDRDQLGLVLIGPLVGALLSSLPAWVGHVRWG